MTDKIIKFSSAQDMLSYLQDDNYLYNSKTGDYVFRYNSAGSIAVYSAIRQERATQLAMQAEEQGECWSALLGPGGSIYDDPSYEAFDPALTSNLQWCKDHYLEDGWVDTSDVMNNNTSYEYWRENIMDERLVYLESDEKYEMYLRWKNNILSKTNT